MIGKVLGILGRHPVAVAVTIIVIGLPVIMVMSPIILFMSILWGSVALSEAKRCNKRNDKD